MSPYRIPINKLLELFNQREEGKSFKRCVLLLLLVFKLHPAPSFNVYLSVTVTFQHDLKLLLDLLPFIPSLNKFFCDHLQF